MIIINKILTNKPAYWRVCFFCWHLSIQWSINIILAEGVYSRGSIETVLLDFIERNSASLTIWTASWWLSKVACIERIFYLCWVIKSLKDVNLCQINLNFSQASIFTNLSYWNTIIQDWVIKNLSQATNAISIFMFVSSVSLLNMSQCKWISRFIGFHSRRIRCPYAIKSSQLDPQCKVG